MKYMGSKRVMLTNGLGKAINHELAGAKRFVDLFLGTGEVASFVARNHDVPVFGVDLQAYSVYLTEAIIGRCHAISWLHIWVQWILRAQSLARESNPPLVHANDQITKAFVDECRNWCVRRVELPITRAYGGHYFSPAQSVWIDALRATLPKPEEERTLALASLIRAASQCVAAPGHTAQPLQPTSTAGSFLKVAWLRDVTSRVATWLTVLAKQHARKRGAARVADANEIADSLDQGDLVFLDPPYSGVQYSRFYHVLETIARGKCGAVSGTGRYPDAAQRPKSRFSLVTESEEALEQLLFLVAAKGAKAILTFPDHVCSNGLSGESVRYVAKAYFRVSEYIVASRFSTLGGRGTGKDKVAKRKARHDRKELLLVLRPKMKRGPSGMSWT